MAYPLAACRGNHISQLAILAPPLPAFSNVVASYGLNNFNPVGYPTGLLAFANGAEVFASGSSPYPADLAAFIGVSDPPPYLIDAWEDQNDNTNDLAAAGAARPTLQITTSVIVSGAGTSAANGTYSFTTVLNGRGQYNLTGTSATASSIRWNPDAGNFGLWEIWNAAGDDILYISSDDDASTGFPWLVVTWLQNGGTLPVPTITPSTQKGEIDFDGAATGLATAGNVTLGVQTLTLYLRFKAGSLAETSVLFETGSGAAANKGAISIRMVAGVLTVSVSDQTAVVALLNTKVKTISDSNWHTLSVVIDTTAAAANQVLCWLDGSQTGWTSSIATDLASENLTTSKFNVGARNNAASTFFTGSMKDLLMFSAAQNNTLRGQWESYIQFVNQ